MPVDSADVALHTHFLAVLGTFRSGGVPADDHQQAVFFPLRHALYPLVATHPLRGYERGGRYALAGLGRAIQRDGRPSIGS